MAEAPPAVATLPMNRQNWMTVLEPFSSTRIAPPLPPVPEDPPDDPLAVLLVKVQPTTRAVAPAETNNAPPPSFCCTGVLVEVTVFPPKTQFVMLPIAATLPPLSKARPPPWAVWDAPLAVIVFC